ncbi:VanZ family protein [Flavobacterium ovatum]|uniref:VanZ family protein n=1 Tax=Flavobacterium ovatum TaxID=1928857 RepID=UPI00344F2D3F
MKKISLRVLSFFYFSIVIYVVFFARRRQQLVDFRNEINLFPFQDKINFIQTSSIRSEADKYVFYSDFLGNIVMFIPFVFAVEWLVTKQYSNRFHILTLFLCSFSIESLQFIFNIGVFDIDDLLLNTVGGLLGLLAFNFFNFKRLKS